MAFTQADGWVRPPAPEANVPGKKGVGSQEAGVQRSGLRPTVPGVTCSSPPLQFLSDDKTTGWQPENICATDEAGPLIGLRPAPNAPPRVAGSPAHPGWGDENRPPTHTHVTQGTDPTSLQGLPRPAATSY